MRKKTTRTYQQWTALADAVLTDNAALRAAWAEQDALIDELLEAGPIPFQGEITLGTVDNDGAVRYAGTPAKPSVLPHATLLPAVEDEDQDVYWIAALMGVPVYEV